MTDGAAKVKHEKCLKVTILELKVYDPVTAAAAARMQNSRYNN